MEGNEIRSLLKHELLEKAVEVGRPQFAAVCESHAREGGTPYPYPFQLRELPIEWIEEAWKVYEQRENNGQSVGADVKEGLLEWFAENGTAVGKKEGHDAELHDLYS
jgi:hypothetical protein